MVTRIDFLPNIAQFIKCPHMSVKEEASSLEELFYIPIPQAAAEELEDLRVMIQSFMLSEETDQKDLLLGQRSVYGCQALQVSLSHYADSGCFSLGLEVQGNS